MHLDRLEYKKDFLKGFDGRCRIMSALFLIAALTNVKSFFVLVCVIILCFFVLFRDIYVTFLRLLPVNVFVMALWLPVLISGEMQSALLYTLRINCAALLYMCFVIPMSISNIACSLSKLKVQDKLIALLILTYRYIFLLNEKFFTALKSMRLRNQLKNDVSVWRSLSAVFTSSIINAIMRGKKVWIAMQSRGFDGAFPITIIFKWRFRDTVLLLFSIICSIFIVMSEEILEKI
jgi:energy-coupling factor transporter transmembrane protein EcfT